MMMVKWLNDTIMVVVAGGRWTVGEAVVETAEMATTSVTTTWRF